MSTSSEAASTDVELQFMRQKVKSYKDEMMVPVLEKSLTEAKQYQQLNKRKDHHMI